MGRLPKIILMVAALLVVFLCAFNSCGPKADDLLNDTEDMVSSTLEEGEDFLEDDLFEDNSEDIFEEDDSYEETEFVDEPEEEDIETDFTTTDYTDDQPASGSRPSYTNSNGGDYMVIAGNYLVQSNAQSMIRKLSNLGYPNAQIGVFDRSQYHTVIAMRSDSYSSALEVSNAIKRRGVDCYVKKKQY